MAAASGRSDGMWSVIISRARIKEIRITVSALNVNFRVNYMVTVYRWPCHLTGFAIKWKQVFGVSERCVSRG